jgi:hypothetical protein
VLKHLLELYQVQFAQYHLFVRDTLVLEPLQVSLSVLLLAFALTLLLAYTRQVHSILLFYCELFTKVRKGAALINLLFPLASLGPKVVGTTPRLELALIDTLDCFVNALLHSEFLVF